jgi:hypothetical protein
MIATSIEPAIAVIAGVAAALGSRKPAEAPKTETA